MQLRFQPETEIELAEARLIDALLPSGLHPYPQITPITQIQKPGGRGRTQEQDLCGLLLPLFPAPDSESV